MIRINQALGTILTCSLLGYTFEKKTLLLITLHLQKKMTKKIKLKIVFLMFINYWMQYSVSFENNFIFGITWFFTTNCMIFVLFKFLRKEAGQELNSWCLPCRLTQDLFTSIILLNYFYHNGRKQVLVHSWNHLNEILHFLNGEQELYN